MSIGEEFYLALVLFAFLSFGATLAVVSSRTNGYLRKTNEQAAERDHLHLKKAA